MFQLRRTYTAVGLEEHDEAVTRCRRRWRHLAAQVGTRKWRPSTRGVHAQRIPHHRCRELRNRFVGSSHSGGKAEGLWRNGEGRKFVDSVAMYNSM